MHQLLLEGRGECVCVCVCVCVVWERPVQPARVYPNRKAGGDKQHDRPRVWSVYDPMGSKETAKLDAGMSGIRRCVRQCFYACMLVYTM